MPEYFPQLNLPQGLAEEVARQQAQNAQIMPNAINNAVSRVYNSYMQKKMWEAKNQEALKLAQSNQAGRVQVANIGANAREQAAGISANARKQSQFTITTPAIQAIFKQAGLPIPSIGAPVDKATIAAGGRVASNFAPATSADNAILAQSGLFPPGTNNTTKPVSKIDLNASLNYLRAKKLQEEKRLNAVGAGNATIKSRISGAQQAFSQFEKQTQNLLPTSEHPIIRVAQRLWGEISGKLDKASNASQFDTSRMQTAANIAGSFGRLNDAEVRIVYNALPGFGESKESRANKESDFPNVLASMAQGSPINPQNNPELGAIATPSNPAQTGTPVATGLTTQPQQIGRFQIQVH